MKKIFLLFLIIISTQVFSKGKTVDRIYTREEEEIIMNYLGTFYLHDREPAKNLVIVLSDQYGKIAVFNYVTSRRYLCTPEFDDFDLYEGMNASTCMFLDCEDRDAKKGDFFSKPYIIYCKTENGIHSHEFLNGKFAYTEYKKYIKKGFSPADLPVTYIPSGIYYYRLEEKGE